MALNRRKFITTTAALGGAMIAPLTKDNINNPSFYIPAGFTPIVMATNWGFPGTVDAFCEKAKKEGYDGIEMWWPDDRAKQDDLFNAIKKHGLEIGFLCGAGDPGFEKHFQQFKDMVTAATSQIIQKPLYINCHSGRDYFTFEQNEKFIGYTIQVSKNTGIPISHETHRSRILFAAPIARNFIEAIPGLRVTLDISHWCNVHESLLHDQDETVQLALSRVDHIHVRVGHPEGPQVNDPRAPEWESAVKSHWQWWDKVVELKIKQGIKKLTFLTEFGPPDYLPALPYTRQPVADQWAINAYMLNQLKKRYSNP